MNYDTMSVEQLLDEMDSEVGDGYPRDIKKVAALRRAFIREASVGVVSINLDPTVGFPLIDAPIVTRCDKPCVWVKYDLVPKETP